MTLQFVTNHCSGHALTAHTSGRISGTLSQRRLPAVRNSPLPGFWPLYIFLPLDSPEIGPGALIGASSTSTPTASTTATSGSGGSNTSAIVGGVVGAVATLVFAIVFFGIFYLRRRKRANSGVRMAIEEDASIASPSMPEPPLTSTSGRFSVRVFFLVAFRVAFVLVHVVFFFFLSCPPQDPTVPTSDLLRPEMQPTPWIPDVSSPVVSGPYQGSGSTLPNHPPSSESPPQYSELPTVPAQPSTPNTVQSSPRLRQK